MMVTEFAFGCKHKIKPFVYQFTVIVYVVFTNGNNASLSLKDWYVDRFCSFMLRPMCIRFFDGVISSPLCRDMPEAYWKLLSRHRTRLGVPLSLGVILKHAGTPGSQDTTPGQLALITGRQDAVGDLSS